MNRFFDWELVSGSADIQVENNKSIESAQQKIRADLLAFINPPLLILRNFIKPEINYL
jgi:hypothetical protein